MDWDSLAELTPAESLSVSRLRQAKAPWATASHHLAPAVASTSRSAHRNGASSSSSRAVTGMPAAELASLACGGEALEAAAPISSMQQFYDWYGRVEHSMESQQEQIYHSWLAEIRDHIDGCTGVLHRLEDARALLSEMEANYRYVDENSRSLQLACETMLDDQRFLLELKDAVSTRLAYFRELDTATRLLNLPGEAVVLQESFLAMLARLDECIAYLRDHRDFRDAEVYLIRFHQCLTRSLTLIRMFFVSTVQAVSTDAAAKMSGKTLAPAALRALQYDKFEHAAATLKPLVYELETRAQRSPQDHESLLTECHATWTQARAAALSATLGEEVRRMEPASADLIKLARGGCNYMREVVANEWQLWRKVFTTGEPHFYRAMESFCDFLYDSLRPRILHEGRLDVLCELCTVVGALMSLDADDQPPAEAKGMLTEEGATRANIEVHDHSELHFSVLLQPILQDAQTRLVFRAQSVMQSEVAQYRPAAADLAYPNALDNEGATNELTRWLEQDASDGANEMGLLASSSKLHSSWYPTLRSTLWVLSRLHTYVNDAIFEDFAGEAVMLCMLSLQMAARMISVRADAHEIDGELFLLRHLLFLKELVRSIDLVHVSRASDFTSITDAVVRLLKNSTVIFRPSALIEFATKGFAEKMTDAKTELDSAVRQACEKFIQCAALDVSSEINDFSQRCASFERDSNNTELSSPAWASHAAIVDVHSHFLKRVDERMPLIFNKLQRYLTDQKTVDVLLPPVQDSVIESYTAFYSAVRTHFSFDVLSELLSPTSVRERLVTACSK